MDDQARDLGLAPTSRWYEKTHFHVSTTSERQILFIIWAEK